MRLAADAASTLGASDEQQPCFFAVAPQSCPIAAQQTCCSAVICDAPTHCAHAATASGSNSADASERTFRLSNSDTRFSF